MLTITIDRWPIMDFTSLVMQEAYQLLVPWPEEESRLTAVIRPFHLMVFFISLDMLKHFFGLILQQFIIDLDIHC